MLTYPRIYDVDQVVLDFQGLVVKFQESFDPLDVFRIQYARWDIIKDGLADKLMWRAGIRRYVYCYRKSCNGYWVVSFTGKNPDPDWCLDWVLKGVWW